MTAIAPLNSIVEVTINDEATWWAKEKDSIRAALVDHYGNDLPGDALPEPHDPLSLRSRLRTVAPRLTALADRIRAAFGERACAVVVPTLGLSGVEVDEQRKAVFALAALLGDVMANHPEQSALWDVRNRGNKPGKRVRASSSDRASGMNTDAGYLRIPPRYFLLYAARAARCGGGVSLIRDGRTVKSQLTQTEKGREAIRALSQTVPRLISKKFHHVADVEADGFQYSPVLSDKPLWRWGNKNISSPVLDAKPEFATPEVRQAIDTVSDLLVPASSDWNYRPMGYSSSTITSPSMDAPRSPISNATSSASASTKAPQLSSLPRIVALHVRPRGGSTRRYRRAPAALRRPTRSTPTAARQADLEHDRFGGDRAAVGAQPGQWSG